MKTFAEIELLEPVQRALADEKYETPTPIQAQTVPAALEGRDILGCAQTGTGKTAAFALPILNRLAAGRRKATPNHPLVLVLAPTRELAIQIGESFETYGRHLSLRQVLVYGGVGQGNQVRALNRGAHVLIATPGRLLDLMNQGYIDLDQLEVFVLDEADRMLDMGFLPDIRRIINKLPERRQSMFFSATLPPNIIELSQRLLRNPVSVNVTPKTTTLEKIEQQVLFVEKSGKQALLTQILKKGDVYRVIVFTKTKRGANLVTDNLLRSGITAAVIHGNKSQNARQRALDAFRENQVQVLVATDVAARGIDIDGITHVINFDLPNEPENYVHRIGRTGRAGADGVAISFCSSAERSDLRAIEQLIGQRVPVGASPDQFGREAPAERRGVQRRTASREAVSRQSEPRQAESRETASQPAEPKITAARQTVSRPAEPRTTASRPTRSRQEEPRQTESRETSSRPARSRQAEPRQAEPRRRTEVRAETGQRRPSITYGQSVQSYEPSRRDVAEKRTVPTTQPQRPPRPTTGGAAELSGSDDKPKRRRRRRKGPALGQREQQTS